MPPAPLFSRLRPSLGAHSIREALPHVGIEGRPGGETLRLGIHVAVCGRCLRFFMKLLRAAPASFFSPDVRFGMSVFR